MGDVRLALENVTKTYTVGGTRTRVLRSINLEVQAGEILWINGPSGSGKSSLINIAGLLTAPSSGAVWVEGTDTSRANDKMMTELRSRHIGMIFQSHNLFPELTSIENVLLAARSKDQRELAENLLGQVGLARQSATRAKRLSGGQQQRVAVARALINQPALILADEPVSGLDESNATAVLREFSEAAADGCGVVISSHDPAVASIAHRQVNLEFGAII